MFNSRYSEFALSVVYSIAPTLAISVPTSAPIASFDLPSISIPISSVAVAVSIDLRPTSLSALLLPIPRSRSIPPVIAVSVSSSVINVSISTRSLVYYRVCFWCSCPAFLHIPHCRTIDPTCALCWWFCHCGGWEVWASCKSGWRMRHNRQNHQR
ncbi:hypothetical protein BJX99DRAFT_219367 [Aspergillus californicus]